MGYEGEALCAGTPGLDGPLSLPYHLTGIGEADVLQQPQADSPENLYRTEAPEDTADGLDTRPFYLQEYPRRLEMSASHQPKLMSRPHNSDAPPEPEGSILK